MSMQVAALSFASAVRFSLQLQGMRLQLVIALGARICAVLSIDWWSVDRTIGRSSWLGQTRTAGSLASVCMAAALSESNPITVGNLEVQRIPCLSVGAQVTQRQQSRRL